MCLFATPMLALYMVGVGVAVVVHPSRRKAKELNSS
jgi:sec-independent protein translocase protein TatC